MLDDAPGGLAPFLQAGSLTASASLKKLNWFRTEAAADWLFTPRSVEDLARFLAVKPKDMAHMVIGGGSNLLIRAGGIGGVVIVLKDGFQDISVRGDHLSVGAGAMDVHVARAAQAAGLSGLEFLVGVPGTIGGAIAMNAGAYGAELADILVDATAVTPGGDIITMTAADFDFGYRQSVYPDGLIFVHARLRGVSGDPGVIAARMDDIIRERSASQPIGSRTGGSTFKNPEGHKAWQLVDAAGCRGLTVGRAQMSKKHCNFMINLGGASAEDLEALGNLVRQRVLATSGIDLVWEVRCIGRHTGGQA